MIGKLIDEAKYYIRLIKSTDGVRAMMAVIFFLVLLTVVFESTGIGLIIPLLTNVQTSDDYQPSMITVALGWEFADATEEIVFILVVIIFSVLMKNIFTIASGYTINVLQNKYTNILRIRIVERLYSYRYRYFTEEKVGTLTNIFMTQMSQYISNFSVLPRIASDLLLIIIYTSIVLLVSPELTIITLVLFVIYSLMMQLIIKKVFYYQKEGVRYQQDLNATILEDILGIKLIKCYNICKERLKTHTLLNSKLYRNFLRSVNYGLLIVPGMEMLVVSVVAFPLLYLFLTKGSGAYNYMPIFIGFVVILSRLKQSFTSLNVQRASLGRFRPATENVWWLLGRDDLVETDGTEEFKGLRQGIELRNLSFAYNAEEPVLRNMSFSINRGETVAIVGKSGIGKSSLLQLLLNLEQPIEGEILVDGRALREYRRASWYNHLGVVFQDSFIFNKSVAWNITLGRPDVTEAMMRDAAKWANVEEFVREMPAGYDTVIGDRGTRLSGGQRQRVAIARALASNAEIIFMDEATSAMDSHNEKMINAAISRISQDRTAVIIAHRLSTIKEADRIVVIKDGRVDGMGNHDELLRENAEYQLLYKTQHKSGEGNG